MWWRIFTALTGAVLLALSNFDRTRLNPGTVLELFPNGRLAQLRRPLVLAVAGFFLLVFGCASLQTVIGGWAFAVFAVLIAVVSAPVLRHNRGVRPRS